jgi:hypothetical protein
MKKMEHIKEEDIKKIVVDDVGEDDHQPYIDATIHLKNKKKLKYSSWAGYETAGHMSAFTFIPEGHEFRKNVVDCINCWIDSENDE